MYFDFCAWTYGVRSYSHFWLANSAVQITSELKTSQSSDLACWRWMNWARCWSADAGNSVSVAFQPWAPYLVVKSLTTCLPMPVVSLPWQNLTVPFGGLSSDLASMTLAPSTLTPPPPLVLAPPPPPPPPPPPLLLLLLLPQAARTMQQMNTAPNPNLTFIAPPPPDATCPSPRAHL